MARLSAMNLVSSRAIPNTASKARFEELNGIRGWAALSVVAYHMTWETFGVVLPSFRNPISGFFLDGSLAVSVFFVLSGEAMSSAYFMGGGETAVARLAAKRYTRLTIPIAAACLLTFALYKAGLVYNVQAASVVNRSDWLGKFLNPAPDFIHVIKYIFVGVYTSKPEAEHMIPFLWTMQIELIGSVLVFLTLFMYSRLSHPWLLISSLIIPVLIFAPFYGNYACFMVGLSFANLRSNRFFTTVQNHRSALIASWAVIVLIAILDGLSNWKYLARELVPVTAIVLLFAIFCNRTLCSLFTSKISIFLGRISFPIYLVQFPFLVSITSRAICYAKSHGILNLGMVMIIAGGSVLGCAVAAYAFEPIEAITRWVGSRTVAAVLIDDQVHRRKRTA